MPVNRRNFIKLIGLSGAGALAGCASGGQDQLIPYLVQPEVIEPGVSAEFATVCRECPAGCGMIGRARDGRVYKVEGNPDHPINRGALCLRGQTALQDVYNPDRIRQPLARDPYGRLRPIGWDEAERRLVEALASGASGRVAWIGRLETGPFDRLVDTWLASVAPNHTRLRYEPFAYEALRDTHHGIVPDLRIAAAHMILCFGADFLETWVSNVQYARDFSAWRQARLRGEHNGRYVFIGPRLSLTAANADEWIPVRPGAEGWAAMALAGAIAGERALGDFESTDVGTLASVAGLDSATVERLAREFASNLPSLAIPPLGAGDRASCRAALVMNEVAGNVGRTYMLDRPHALSGASRHEEMLGLLEQMRSGGVRLLLIHEANPVYSLPPGARAAQAIGHVPEVVSFSSYLDETTSLASLLLPDHRPLESWGAYSPRPDVTGILQPLVAPVFSTRQTGDLLLSAARHLGHDLGAADFHTYLQHDLGLAGDAWRAAVERGGVWGTAHSPQSTVVGHQSSVVGQPASGLTTSDSRLTTPPAPHPSSLALHLYPSLHFYDGRNANRPWAQEVPEPMSKAVWGSWAEIHPETAARLSIQSDDVLLLSNEHGRLEIPALVTNRVHPDAVAVQLGQGHTAYGRYAMGIGVNAMALTTVAGRGGGPLLSGQQVTVARLPARRRVVTLQTYRGQAGEEIARDMVLTEARQMGPRHKEQRPSLYHYTPPGPRHWGMAIDLDRCIGCNACAAACHAENNVPVVGREECSRGREMSWLRVENYAPPTVFVPMLCQQCENAPCEYVCPVNATMHDREGLNEQVYNRCVGTRFCSNNCPYKVRRFNWFTYDFPSPLDQQLNPDVIHRAKGVMEKCTFCIQRIRRARIDAAAEQRPIRDGEIQTACQQTCPTDAIVFGDLNDPNSRVRKLADSLRGYAALGDLNTYPNVTYLARVRAETPDKVTG